LQDAFEKSGSLEKLKPAANPLKEIVLTPDKFHIMADRVYFSVLALLRAGNQSVSQIASKLDLEATAVKDALEALVNVGVLKKEDTRYVEPEQVVFRTSENFPPDLMAARRLQNNAGARKAIENRSPGELGYFATVSLDREKLEEVAPIIEDFLKRLCLFIRKPKSEDIFEISVDLFPWSK